MNPFVNTSPKTRQMVVTAVVAALTAVFAEHYFKPALKGRLKVP